MKFKRRSTEVFSLSFLDCICCGFGAVLLLFVLTAGNKASIYSTIEAKISQIIGEMTDSIAKKDKELETLRAYLLDVKDEHEEISIELDEKKSLRTDLDDSLALLMKELALIEEALGKLMKDKEEIPKVEEKPPIPIPNEERRQYLTGFDMKGDHILFLVEASGSMLDDEVTKAAERLQDEDEEKKKAPKWVRTKNGLQWLIANFVDKTTRYKIIFFNNELHPLETDSGGTWHDPFNADTTLEVLDLIDEIVPGEGANLEIAFDIVDDLDVVPNRIVLIADGLPTLADSYSKAGLLSDVDRINMFRAAKKILLSGVPVNTILYPMLNDPAAAVHFWRLSNERGGAMVCPSESWPDI
ncbi:hypothetical protein MLD52_17185 [Puniceicoccaceae bacterium K14]|nr:hypothetical protein [Puniceicoccaceae bacterium K14]